MARVWAEIEALEPTDAERKLIAACCQGTVCNLGDGRPDAPNPGQARDLTRTIRARILRYLILGGCEARRVHERGVILRGAYIDGLLELSFATARGQTELSKCRFSRAVMALYASFETLVLSGSALPRLNIRGARVAGSLRLDDGFKASGEVSLSRARIGDDLICNGGTFKNPQGHSLLAQGLQVTGDVFLRRCLNVGEVSLSGATIGGELNCRCGRFCNRNNVSLSGEGLRVAGPVFLDSGFKAHGEVRLSGAIIGGQLSCSQGIFDNPKGNSLYAASLQVTNDVFLYNGFISNGRVNFSGARIGGQLSCSCSQFCNREGDALNAQGMKVVGSFVWRCVSNVQGKVVLTSAHVGDLVDDLNSWPQGEDHLILHGFTYNRISGAFTDSKNRLEWLKRGTVRQGEFFPQPYTQLAKVLREMGYDQAARDVLVELGRLIRLHSRERARALQAVANVRLAWLKRCGVLVVNVGRWVWDLTQRAVVGYGYKPYRSLGAFAVLWCAAAVLGSLAWSSGAMVPNSDVVLTSAGWQAVAPLPDPADAWTAAGAAGEDWETFNSLAWGFDAVVPVLSLGQTEAWTPSAARGPWGWLAWWGCGVLSVFGWVVVGLAAAAVTGIIRRE